MADWLEAVKGIAAALAGQGEDLYRRFASPPTPQQQLAANRMLRQIKEGDTEAFMEDAGDTPGVQAAMAMAGSIRPGGNPNLMLHHGAKRLTGFGGGTLKELLHPSLAITKGPELSNPFGEALLIPKVGAFDPAYSTSTLFNRDAYVARGHDYPGGYTPTARDRMLSRELSPPPSSEGYNWTRWAQYPWEPNINTAHTTSMYASPAFKSFAEYENSAKGAKLLVPQRSNDIPEWSEQFSDLFRDWARKRMGPDVSFYHMNWINELRKAAPNDPIARGLLESAQKAPSDYAELKISGPVPLTGERWAGALLPRGMMEHADTLAARGIPSVEKNYGVSETRAFEIADAMQRMAGPVKETSLRPSAGWSPDLAAPPRQVHIEGRPEPAPAPVEPLPKSLTGLGWKTGKSGYLEHPSFNSYIDPDEMGHGFWVHAPNEDAVLYSTLDQAVKKATELTKENVKIPADVPQ